MTFLAGSALIRPRASFQIRSIRPQSFVRVRGAGRAVETTAKIVSLWTLPVRGSVAKISPRFMPLPVGTRLGPYEIIAPLGEGCLVTFCYTAPDAGRRART
jgi:hypothetical protein